jgi:hypothetical protein
MQSVLEPKLAQNAGVHDGRGLLSLLLKQRMSPLSYLKIVGFSSIIEGVYAARLYVGGGAAAIIGVPLLQRYFAITRDQALTTMLVPVLLSYVTLKLLFDILSPQCQTESSDNYPGWLFTPLLLILTAGFGLFFLSIGIIVSIPIYRIVHVTWVTNTDVVIAAATSAGFGIVLSAVTALLLGAVTQYCKRSGMDDVPNIAELLKDVLSRAERQERRNRLTTHFASRTR